MNCVNHPDVAAAAYCQNCGKALCTGCLRSVGGVVYCEPCLAARLSPPPGAAGVFSGSDLSGMHAHPVLAGLLGFIPGVGAMYNGQFVKALAHVLIFAVFVSLADKSFIFALLIPAWVFYQVFDAAQTAKARRDGLPLPNPFGLNDLAARLGVAPTPPAVAPYAAGFAPSAGPTVTGPATAAGPASAPVSAGSSGSVPPPYTAAYAVPPTAPPPPGPAYSGPPYSATPYSPPPALEPRRRQPVGAIVLIGVGMVLLLQTLGVLEQEWISRAWPVVIIGIGAWLLYCRTHDHPPGGPPL